MTKKILIVKAHSDVCGNEIGLVKNHSELIGMDYYEINVGSLTELEKHFSDFKNSGMSFDYLYLCTHGSTNSFDANMSGVENTISWAEFASSLCVNGILSDHGIILLACCRGGIAKVAYDIFACCNTVQYICGIKWTIEPWDITTGYIVFLHSMEKRGSEPAYAAQKASLATDFTFTCYDREEIETLPAYHIRANQVFNIVGWTDEDGNWIETDPNVNLYADKDVLFA